VALAVVSLFLAGAPFGAGPTVASSPSPLNWYQVTTSRAPPPGDAHIVDDLAAGYILLYEQVQGSPCNSSGETWSFAHGQWSQLQPTVTPPPRGGAAMTYDATDGYAVLFGGVGCRSNFLNDTWTFAGGTWTNATSNRGPSPRETASMAYNGLLRVVLLFGGYGPTGQSPVPLDRFNDTWRWVAGKWRPIVLLPTAPAPRSLAGMAYDALGNQTLLFGGATDSPPLTRSDTWVFDDAWVNLRPSTSPGARTAPAITTDSSPAGALLFGGVGPNASEVLGDTWLFAAGVWTNESGGTGPPPREGASMAVDPSSGWVVLFGGTGVGGSLNDTWTLNATAAPATGVASTTSPWTYVLIVIIAAALADTLVWLYSRSRRRRR
jgi:hypothetical protein